MHLNRPSGRAWARLWIAAAALALVAPATAAPAKKKPLRLATPVVVAPARNAKVVSIPQLEWKRVPRVDHFEWQISSGTGFNAVVASGSTRNVVGVPDKQL